MTSTFTKILVAAAAVSALSVAACSKKTETTNNVVETTNVVEVAPADANALPADTNAADANVVNAVAP
jgi:ABC-type oligopeptide transport system substrate-binding subunit